MVLSAEPDLEVVADIGLGLRNAAEITAYAVKLGLYDPT